MALTVVLIFMFNSLIFIFGFFAATIFSCYFNTLVINY